MSSSYFDISCDFCQALANLISDLRELYKTAKVVSFSFFSVCETMIGIE